MTNWKRELRTLLTLGRVSNLPTVWSNCLAGWLLANGGSLSRFGLLCVGASCAYVGGMFLNDAFDYDFDLRHRKERPLPSGAISREKVWGWGLGWLLAGGLLLTLLGTTTSVLSLLLIGCIVLYNAVHKLITFSPVLMAVCRLLLYLIAASAAVSGVTGMAIWSGLALAVYIVGLSYMAARESARGPLRYWPSWLLGAPILLGFIANGAEYGPRAALLSMLLAIWIIWCLRETFWTPRANVGRTVSGLLAGICLVDLLAVAGGTPLTGPMFLLLFLAALSLQRLVPAT